MLEGADADEERVLFAMAHHYRWGPAGRHVVAKVQPLPLAVAAIGRGHWLIRDASGEELYHAGDAAQRSNLAAEGADAGAAATPRRAADLRRAAATLREAAAAHARPRTPTPLVAWAEEREAELRSLGYVE